MAKFYIVAKEKGDYSLITINKGKCLEDIDLLTNNFNSREEFLRYLKRRGYQFSDYVDLFIVNTLPSEFLEELDVFFLPGFVSFL